MNAPRTCAAIRKGLSVHPVLGLEELEEHAVRDENLDRIKCNRHRS
jgi:hypothetical protein